MTMHEIPRDRWPDYLDQFSRVHRDWPARVETTIDTQPESRNAADLPLLGVTDERVGGREQITIMLGRMSNAHLSHTIEQPLKMRGAEWNDGYSGLLEIESADGARTTVQVGPPEQTLPPQIITDGVL